MSTGISPLAGKPAPESQLIDLSKLLAAYADLRPDPAEPGQRVAFGTSGHRCPVRAQLQRVARSGDQPGHLRLPQQQRIDGPLFVGADTHALSQPAFESALEVLAANGVESLISRGGEFTPTPAVSHAILVYNRGRSSGLADGIVITPSHNPPDNGGFKYNPPNGGPAGSDVTGWIEARANALLADGLATCGAHPSPSPAGRQHPWLRFPLRLRRDLAQVIDFAAIRAAGLHLAVDPLGGAGVHYWRPSPSATGSIWRWSARASTRVSLHVPGLGRQDPHGPSSPYAMQRLLDLKERYDLAFACDTDHDRHGIVTTAAGCCRRTITWW
jgi:phosphoglucomutase